MGQNPTSGVLSLGRRRELYALCSEYDIIIVEDDPYWYLQYPSSTAGKPQGALPAGWKKSGFDFLDSLVPSSLNVDTDGRVLRLDTFSKTVAPGCRLGWITGQPALIERILRVTETSTQQPSGFVQSVIAEMISGPQNNDKAASDVKGWKADGWIRWIEGLRGNYERRMKAMCEILDSGRDQVKSGRKGSLVGALQAALLQDPDTKTLDDDEWSVVEKTRMYSFDWPVGGMFIWLRVHYENHPLANKVDGARLSKALWVFFTLKPYLVLVSPGQIFSPSDEIRDKEGFKYFRLCFAAVDEPEVVPISHRLKDAVNAFWRIKDTKTIDNLIAKEDEDPTVAEHADIGNLSGICF